MTDLLIKYKALILYGIFGVLTTIVNIVTYWFATRMLNFSTVSGTVIAWTVAVLFAYVSNRRWVFHSDAVILKDILREAAAFFVCRIATGLFDVAVMYILVELLGFNDVVIKTLSNVAVVVLNYIGSKLLVFKKSK